MLGIVRNKYLFDKVIYLILLYILEQQNCVYNLKAGDINDNKYKKIKI